MNLEQIKSIVSKLHGGASYIVTYRTLAKTTDGSVAYKLTSKPCRLGVRYGNLKQMKGIAVNPLPGNGHWVIDKYVYQDNNGYKLRITNGAFGKPKSTYVDASDNEVDLNKIVKSAPRSYIPAVQCICLENVISIQKKGETL